MAWPLGCLGQSSQHPEHAVDLGTQAELFADLLRPWGSDFFRLVADHSDVCVALPPAVHRGALEAYIAGASHRGLTPAQMRTLTPRGRPTKDSWIPVDRATRLVGMIPGAEIEVIDGAGHLVQYDAPVELAVTQQRWLQGRRTH